MARPRFPWRTHGILAAVLLAALAGCASWFQSETILILNDYHFELHGLETFEVPASQSWPVVHAGPFRLEVRDGRLLLDDRDHGPIAPRQVIELDRRGRLSVDGERRSPMQP